MALGHEVAYGHGRPHLVVGGGVLQVLQPRIRGWAPLGKHHWEWQFSHPFQQGLPDLVLCLDGDDQPIALGGPGSGAGLPRRCHRWRPGPRDAPACRWRMRASRQVSRVRGGLDVSDDERAELLARGFTLPWGQTNPTRTASRTSAQVMECPREDCTFRMLMRPYSPHGFHPAVQRVLEGMVANGILGVGGTRVDRTLWGRWLR